MQTTMLHANGTPVTITTERKHHHAGDYYETTAWTQAEDGPALVTFVDANGVRVLAYSIANTEEEASRRHRLFREAASGDTNP